MTFYGIRRVFSTKNEQQYNTIGAFWDEMAQLYGRENLRGLGFNWTDNTIEYAIGLREGVLKDSDAAVTMPDSGWVCVKGKTAALGEIYNGIYKDGSLKYEIEMFTDAGDCEIWYCR